MAHMSKRNTALAEARIAGYHGNNSYFTRLIIEARVNRQAMNSAWANGAAAKIAGVRCDCSYCRLTGGSN